MNNNKIDINKIFLLPVALIVSDFNPDLVLPAEFWVESEAIKKKKFYLKPAEITKVIDDDGVDLGELVLVPSMPKKMKLKEFFSFNKYNQITGWRYLLLDKICLN